MKQKLLYLAILGAALSVHQAQALPDARKGNPLPAMGIQTPAGVGDVVVDHEFPTTLHVGPAAEKEIVGIYTELGSSGPMCADFINIHSQAYLLPTTVAQKEAAYKRNDYFSNFFQIVYSIPRSSIEGLSAIKRARDQIRNAGTQNQALIARYNTLNYQWTELSANISSLKSDIKDLDTQQNTEMNQCFLANAGDQTAIMNCMMGVMNKFNARRTALSADLTKENTARDAIKNEYYTVKGQYEAVAKELELLESDVSFHTMIIKSQLTVAQNAWQLEKDIVDVEGRKVVGRASAGYNLFAQETANLTRALQNAGQHQYSVKQLDVFNVALNSGVTVGNPTVESSGAPLFTKNTFAFPADTLVNNRILADWKMPFERAERGNTIHFDAMDRNSFASGGLDFYVTKAARCGEYTQEVTEEYSGSNGSQTASWKVIRKSYEPQPNRVVFSQMLGLSYNYYAYPGPIKGECSIDVDRMSSYWRNAGTKKSWSWFRSKTESWDNTRSEARDNMGMDCKLDLVPETNDPVEAKKIAEQFEREMYNDMWQMFLAIYAKSYDVEVQKPDVKDPGKSTVGEALGSGVLKICPANVYCQFANIVLKTLDELGGSKAQGTTSSVNQRYGKIWKRYNKNTWTIKQGNSLIKAKVCIDAKQCN